MASELPWDVLKQLVCRFGIPHAVVRFKSVCSSWGSSAAAAANEQELFPCSSTTPPPQFLGLMLPGDKTDRRDFYSPLDDKVYKNLLRVPDEHLCRGNRDGWLITLSFSTRNVCLLNPLTGDILQTVTFPSITSLQQVVHWNLLLNRSQFFLFVKRAALSANPSDPTATALTMMVIFDESNRYLSYAREGDEAWLLVQEIDQYSPYEDRFGPYEVRFGPYENQYSPYQDIIYYKDGFYAVNQIGTVFSVDIDCSGHTVRVVVPPVPGEQYDFNTAYLVESSDGDHLLLVSREKPTYHETGWFVVYQLDLKNQTKTEISDLGDQCLFLGVNTSLSIPSPEKIGLRKNYIYYTDESGGNDVGQFELGTDNYCVQEQSFGDFAVPQPMWLTLFNN